MKRLTTTVLLTDFQFSKTLTNCFMSCKVCEIDFLGFLFAIPLNFPAITIDKLCSCENNTGKVIIVLYRLFVEKIKRGNFEGEMNSNLSGLMRIHFSFKISVFNKKDVFKTKSNELLVFLEKPDLYKDISLYPDLYISGPLIRYVQI